MSKRAVVVLSLALTSLVVYGVCYGTAYRHLSASLSACTKMLKVFERYKQGAPARRLEAEVKACVVDRLGAVDRLVLPDPTITLSDE